MREFDTLADLEAAVGEHIGTSEWVTITQQMINEFAEVTGDHQWIHTDPERTKKELDMTTIAHGYLTLSMVPRFMDEIFKLKSVKRVVNYGSDKIRFTNMVPVDSRIRGKAVLKELKFKRKFWYCVFELTVEIEGAAKPALLAETITLLFED